MKTAQKEGKLKLQSGVTLVEIILYVTLLTTLLVVGVDLLLKAGEFGLESGTKSILQEDARLIMNRFTYEVHQATAINNLPTIGSNDTKLDITIPVGFATENREYILSGTNLVYKRLIAATPSANMNSNRTKVNSFLVTRLGTASAKPTLKITFELEALKKPVQNSGKEIFETVLGQR